MGVLGGTIGYIWVPFYVMDRNICGGGTAKTVSNASSRCERAVGVVECRRENQLIGHALTASQGG